MVEKCKVPAKDSSMYFDTERCVKHVDPYCKLYTLHFHEDFYTEKQCSKFGLTLS